MAHTEPVKEILTNPQDQPGVNTVDYNMIWKFKPQSTLNDVVKNQKRLIIQNDEIIKLLKEIEYFARTK